MKNKGAVVVLTIIITLLCVYYLSFTFVSRGIQEEARAYATDTTTGVVSDFKKQQYLDSIWNLPVYSLFGVEYTYKDIKDTELNLGLDLQGGMHVVLEVSPVDIIRGLSGNSEDEDFLEALRLAREKQKDSQASYVDLFYESYNELAPGKKLSPLFATAANRGRISASDDDDVVLDVLKQEVADAIDRSEIILRTRVDQFGTSQPNIQRLPGTGRIQIEIPGAENPERVRKLLQGVAKLEFWEVVESYNLEALQVINDKLAEEARNAPTDISDIESNINAPEEDLSSLLGGDTTSTADELAELVNPQQDSIDSAQEVIDSLQEVLGVTGRGVSPLISLATPPGSYVYDISDTSDIGRILRRDDIQSLLPRNIRYMWDAKSTESNGRFLLPLNFVRAGRGGGPLLEGDVITNARADFDQYGKPAVSMQMNASGSRKWAQITREASAKSPKGRVAVVLDDYVYSAPSVLGEIPNGNSQITGVFTQEEVKDLANILKAGSLPAPTRIVEEAIVGPTLGQVAQNQGIVSILSGLAIVVIFMIAYYSSGGLVANLALLFNIFFILGILANYNAALTLPGIAGIVLTIGMSIDANVLIFERIREEQRRGMKLRESIKQGYQKAFWTIFDSNLTTLIAALVLILLGQGPVKGFAVTLMIGIFCSFFSAVYITRVIVEWMVRKGDDAKVSFKTALSQGLLSDMNLNFIGNRKKAYIFSAIFIVVGVGSIFTQGGLNLGVDFKGGRSYVVAFGEPVVATNLKIDLTNSFQDNGTEVKNFGGNSVVKVTTAYLIDDESDVADGQVRNALISGIETSTGKTFVAEDANVNEGTFTIAGSGKVGATIADDIKNASMRSIAFALILIFAYIAIRFRKWQFGLGAIAALFHDVLFVLGAYGIAGLLGMSFEVDQVFIAAVLTIIGYSINDTVIVFDRIREYLGLQTSRDNVKIFNSAINSTLNRTVVTSATTLFVVLVLFLFGGEVLRGFSFALMIGVLVGTYSSMFVASPIVVDLAGKGVPDKDDGAIVNS